MGQIDGQRHERGRFVARVAEHHSLVARSLEVEVVAAGARPDLLAAIDTLGDVGTLRIESDEHTARLAVEAVLGVVVADALDDLARNFGNLDVLRRGDLTRHQAQSGGHQRFAGDTSVRVLGEDRIEHRIGNLIGHLVGVTFGHALGCERPLSAHRCS